jgi:hypothetical protein
MSEKDKTGSDYDPNVIKLGAWSYPAGLEPCIRNCDFCGTEYDSAKLSPEIVTKIMQGGMMMNCAVTLMHLVAEAAEKKTPLLSQIGRFNRGDGETVFEIDLWAGVGETMISRLMAKNAEITALKEAMRAYIETPGADALALMEVLSK